MFTRPANKGTGTLEQEAIWQEIASGKSHLVIDARAGTGKTYTLEAATQVLPKGCRAMLCAFNKHIASELHDRVIKRGVRNCLVTTLHSFGYFQIRKACEENGTNIIFNKHKVDSILAGLGIPNRRKLIWPAIKKLVELCKAHLVGGSDEATLRRFVQRFGIQMPPKEQSVFRHIPAVLYKCCERTSEIDFDDMIWLPLVNELRVQQFPFVFVDEAQDLNPAQQELALRACPAGRLVVVGDRFQAIYGFRGADTESIQTMEDLLRNTSRGVKTLPLKVTRRCPRRHVALARMIVSDIDAPSNAPDGEVLFLPSLEQAERRIKPGDMVLCRTNAPLISLAEKLRKRGVPAVIQRSDSAKGLLFTLHRLKADTLSGLAEHIAEESAALESEPHFCADYVVQMQDTYDCLLRLTAACSSLDELRSRIESMFQDIETATGAMHAVLLSTIHGAKGLERDIVYLIESRLLPHPRAAAAWELDQERNMAYVAITRAKQEIVFVGEVSKFFVGQQR